VSSPALASTMEEDSQHVACNEMLREITSTKFKVIRCKFA
jgi:hypothetical protein